MSKRLVLVLMVVAQIAVGCAWVRLTPEGDKVLVLSTEEVVACQVMGKTTVSLADKIAGFSRKPENVQKELEALARNCAANVEGDAVVPASEIVGGKQVFNIYYCVAFHPPNG